MGPGVMRRAKPSSEAEQQYKADTAFAALYRVFGDELIAFRDITNSARRLFKSEGETRTERPTGGAS